LEESGRSLIEILSGHFPAGSAEKPRKSSMRTAGITAEIRNLSAILEIQHTKG
jgi:hypothetical protein